MKLSSALNYAYNESMKKRLRKRERERERQKPDWNIFECFTYLQDTVCVLYVFDYFLHCDCQRSTQKKKKQNKLGKSRIN